MVTTDAHLPLLTAKFFRPQPPAHQTPRPHLVQRLNDGLALGRPVTLVSAPAGYGKSSVIAEWASQLNRPLTWLSLEEIDDEPLRFFTYLLAAIQRVDDNVGLELSKSLLAGQLPPTAVILTTLLNDLIKSPTPCLCALDDFHNIQDHTILGILSELAPRASPQFHLVLITREDPAMPLARWRAMNQLTELRANDLRFSEAEADHFFRRMLGKTLAKQDIAHLQQRTEGWIVGLQLAGLSMQGRQNPSEVIATLSGGHRYILSYLTEEVLKLQEPEIQQFLLQTSILSRLTGDLCDAVVGRSGSANLLEALLAANLFIIPLDDDRRWYRYHHLFADLLRNQLQRQHPEWLVELHQRASIWYESHAMPAEAIEHALAAGQSRQVISLLEKYAWGLLNQGLARRIETWIQAIPVDQRAYSPRLSLDFAWMNLLRGNLGAVIPYLQQAETTLGSLNPLAAETTALRAEALALAANLAQTQGRFGEAASAAQHALRLVDPQNTRVASLAYLGLGAAQRQAAEYPLAVQSLQEAIRLSQACADPVTGILAASHLTLMSIQLGQLRFAAETASLAIDWLEKSPVAPPPIVGAVHGAIGLIYYEWNLVEKARQHLLRGIQLGVFSGHNASVIYTRVNLARLLQGEGDLAGAAKSLAEAAELFAQGAPGWVGADLIARQASLLLAQGKLLEAEICLRQSGVSIEDEVTPQTEAIHLAWLRLMYAQKQDRPRALALAQRILDSAQAGPRNAAAIQVLLLGALVQAESNRSASLEWLRRAVELAEPEGYIRIFTDEGVPLLTLLQRIPGTPYTRKLLASATVIENKLPADVEAPQGQPFEPLSERELEVLRLLSQGLKYAEIAANLVVSVNTVRFHVKKIYAKLGVDKQAKAIEQARRLNLL